MIGTSTSVATVRPFDMPRERKGQLLWRPTKGWCARVTVVVDDEKIRRVVALGTRDRVVARRKLAKLQPADVAYR